MTDLQSPPNYQPPHQPTPYGQPNPQFQPMPPMDPAQAAAYAKAAKAHAKGLRPWFKKKRFIVPIAAVALFGVSKAFPGGSDSATPTAVPAAAKPAAESKADAPKAEAPKAEVAQGPGLGDAVKSGDFLITITKVKAGVKSVGPDFLKEKAQGQFVLVNLKATNEGDESKMLFGDNVKLMDAQGREFSVNSMASISVSENNPLLEEINPGNTSKGTLVFDLPKGVKPVSAEVSGGLFDEAVTVDLTN